MTIAIDNQNNANSTVQIEEDTSQQTPKNDTPLSDKDKAIVKSNEDILTHFSNGRYNQVATKQQLTTSCFAYVPNRSLGVDVSSYQGTDLTPFANLGAKFAIVKTTQGTDYVNPHARGQIASAKSLGMMVQGYHYATFGGNSNSAVNEANYAINNAGSLGIPSGSYYACDYEQYASGDIEANTQAVKSFMRTVKNRGYIPVLYSGAYYMKDHLNLSEILQEFPNSLWVASYATMGATDNPDFNYFPSMDGVMMWQFTSNWHGQNVDSSINVLPLEDNVGSSNKISDGQHQINGYWYYYKDGQPVKNNYVWIDDEHKECYYDNDGHMVYGQQKIWGHWQYFDPTTGAQVKNGYVWLADDNKEVYYDGNGNMVYGEQQINGHWQYFDPTTGAQVKNNFVDLPDGRSVYYDNNGNMIYGLQEVWGAKRYFDTSTGAELKNSFKDIDGKTYYFGNDGAMRYGMQDINGTKYFFNSDGNLARNQLVQSNGKTYYCNSQGKIVYNQNVTVNGKTYHFGSDGSAVVYDGWQYYDGAEHYYKDGQMLTGWQTIDGQKTYFDPQDGAQSKNKFQCIDGQTYYFDSQGHLLDGLQEVNGKTYLFGSEGQVEYGQHFYDGNWYYFDDATGEMVKNQMKTVYDIYHHSNQQVYYDNNGHKVINAWHAVNGKEFYFDNNGNLAQSGVYRFTESNGNVDLIYFNAQGRQQPLSGWQLINGEWYDFDDNTGMAYHDCFKRATDDNGNQIIVYLNNKGQRAKGTLNINGQTYVFDNETGALKSGNPPANID